MKHFFFGTVSFVAAGCAVLSSYFQESVNRQAIRWRFALQTMSNTEHKKHTTNSKWRGYTQRQSVDLYRSIDFLLAISTSFPVVVLRRCENAIISILLCKYVSVCMDKSRLLNGNSYLFIVTRRLAQHHFKIDRIFFLLLPVYIH